MVIDINGNGSFLFQSLDPSDLSLYTWDQSDSNAGFIQVSNVIIGNTSGQINLFMNVFTTNANSFTYSIGANSVTILKAQPPTVTMLLCANNTTSQTGTYTPPAGVTWLKVRMVGGGGGGAAWNSSIAGLAQSGSNSIFGNVSTVAVTCSAGLKGTSVTAGVGGNVSTIGVSAANGWVVYSVNGVAGQGSFTPGPASNATYTGGYSMGGSGGSTPLGGGGGAGGHTIGGWGGIPGTGGGGGGAGGENPSVPGGAGGGAGAYVEIYITQIANNYPYTIGRGGFADTTTPTSGGQNGGRGVESIGGDGGSGSITVEEYYGF